jgi:hypothetical protein
MLLAAFTNGPHADEIQPWALRAPEVFIGSGWGASADIHLAYTTWTLQDENYFDSSIRFFDGGLVIPLVGNGTFRRRSLHWGTISSRFYAWNSRDEFDASCFPEGKRFKEYFKDGGPDDLSL